MTSDAEVVQLSRRRPEAFADLFDRHHAAVHAYVARRAGRQAADDVLSEVFTVAFAQRERYVAETGSALPWLYGIARNLTHRHLRVEEGQRRTAQKWGGSHVGRDDHDGTDEAVAGLDASRVWPAVRDVLSGVAAEDREALLLFAWEELSYADVATVLGVPLGTVKSRIHRARTALRAALADTTCEGTIR